jgi:hypothetical protein
MVEHSPAALFLGHNTNIRNRIGIHSVSDIRRCLLLNPRIGAISENDTPSIVRVGDLVHLHGTNYRKECYQDRGRSLRRRSLDISGVLCTMAEKACAYSMLSAAVKPFNL